MARPKKQVKESLPEPIFYVKIMTNDDIFESTGDDLMEILGAYFLPPIFKTETNIIVIKDKKVVQRDLKVSQARQIFNNHVSLEIFTKRLLNQLE